MYALVWKRVFGSDLASVELSISILERGFVGLLFNPIAIGMGGSCVPL